MTDLQLISRAARGDETAFELLWERHWHGVYSYAWLLARNVPDAEDITQETFLALMRRPAAFDPARAQLRTWLIAVARRQYLNRSRKSGREIAAEDLDRVADSPPAIQELILLERAEAVRSAVSQLPEAPREALYLFEFEELSLAEIASILNIEANAVKARLYRAREQLTRLLAPLKPAKNEKRTL